jgi:hypothetical protein
MNNVSPTSGITGWLTEQRTASGRVLLIVGTIIAALAAWLLYQSGSWTKSSGAAPSDMPLLLTGLFFGWIALAFLGSGGWQLSRDSSDERKPLAARVVLLILTGAIGSGLFVLGLALLYLWGETLTKLLREGEREGAWRVLLALAAIVGGLFVMFAGLQSVRSDECKIIGIRRYVYGFNAFLTGFLLLAVLIVVNVISYLKIPATIDATQTGMFTLSNLSKQVLAELHEPTTIFMFFMSPEDEVYNDLRGLLLKCQELAPQLKVETVTRYDRQRVLDLVKQYPLVAEGQPGVLIVINDDKNRSSFIPDRELISRDFNPMTGGSGNDRFIGEQKIINELTFLQTGKQKPVIYISQGFGEPDLSDQSRRAGLGLLRDRLQRRNFDVKPLKFDPISPQVPDDAKIVVIAGPKQPLPPLAVDALKRFLDAGGKMMAMLDVVEVPRSEHALPATGLEQLLASYGVEVTKEQIFSLVPVENQVLFPTDQVFAEVDPSAANQPIVAPFKSDLFNFSSCRLVRPAPNMNNPQIRVQTLLQTKEGIGVWTESDPQIDPRETMKTMARDPNARKRLTEKLPMMLAVSESPRSAPGVPAPPEKPKLIVFGDTTFISNVRADVRAEALEFDLFISSLEWLRERPANIGIEPKEYQYFELDRGVVDYYDRLRFLPLLVASVIMVGFGIGVWLVRRQ